MRVSGQSSLPTPRHCFDFWPFLKLFTILNTTHLKLLSRPFAAAPLGVFDGECFEVCERHFWRHLPLDNIPGSQRSLFNITTVDINHPVFDAETKDVELSL